MIIRFVAYSLVGLVLTLPAQFANAQTTSQGQAAPSQGPAAAPQAAIQPNLSQSNAELTRNVREELASDKTTLDTLIRLLKEASPDQQTAIAQGIAQAAKAYAANNDPAFANQIQVAIAATGLIEVVKAYAAIAGDTGTASTGGGGGGGGGGGPSAFGAPTGGQNGGTSPGGSTFAANNGTNFLTGATLGAAGSTFTQTTPTSVSPQ